jgi:ABC-type polar amino acid transport system ATPase subunit
MNVLYGLLQPDDGEIVIDGAAQFTNPREAMAAGIGMVHQHFMLVDVFTVAENIMLGREGGALLNAASARKRVLELSSRYSMPVEPDALIEDLPVGVQQRVEILKALANDARFLVFDEPTAVFTPQEIDDLMRVMQSLRDEGKAIVFITHKLREVRAIADRITVMRRGKIVGHAEPAQLRSGPRRADGGPRRRPAGREDTRPPRRHPACRPGPAGGQPRRRHRRRRGQFRGRRGRDLVRRGRPGQRPVRTRRRAAGHMLPRSAAR